MQENLKKENIKSGFYSIPVTEMTIMMITGHIGIGCGWPNPDGCATAHNRHIGLAPTVIPTTHWTSLRGLNILS